MQAYDWEDASITDSALIKFLAGSEQWLDSLVEVNLKKCHHVTPKLLAFLRSACPKLRKLAPSRWADHSALRDIAAFPCLEVRAVAAHVCSYACRCALPCRHAGAVALAATPACRSKARVAAGHIRYLVACCCAAPCTVDAYVSLLLLQELDLGDADADIITIDDLGLTALTGLSHSLKRLGLSRCRWVSDAAFATLCQLYKLEVLDLSHTDIGPRGLSALAGLPNLHTINLTGCRCAAGMVQLVAQAGTDGGGVQS
jgi:hypothetical protein